MPGNLIGSTPNGVMPASLCTAFSELREYAQLQNQFHDGTIQRSQLAQTSRRTFHLSKRLSSSLLSALYSFWVSQNGGLTPFVFYNPFDVTSGQQIGSQLRSDGQQYAGTRHGRVPWHLGAGYGHRADECAGDRTGGGIRGTHYGYTGALTRSKKRH
jgi:hypothetical protein